jgi:hypothetical protein
MADIFETVSEFSYIGIFLLFIGINAAPLLMPPTWIILASFYVLDPKLDPLILSMVGATGATIGRFILKQISSFFRKFIGKEQKSNLDVIGNYLNRKRFGYPLASFLFAATPLPSNMLFIAYGLMRAKNIGLYIGFWFGRLISYYIMITISEVVLTPFLNLFEDRIVGILLADVVGIGVIILFMSINWTLLLTERKFKFVKPKLWRF